MSQKRRRLGEEKRKVAKEETAKVLQAIIRSRCTHAKGPKLRSSLTKCVKEPSIKAQPGQMLVQCQGREVLGFRIDQERDRDQSRKV
ncbi:hypothetical protein CR513_61601, partial [Mucuna pruriens]